MRRYDLKGSHGPLLLRATRTRWIPSSQQLYKRFSVFLFLYALCQLFGPLLFGLDTFELAAIAMKTSLQYCSAVLTLLLIVVSGSPFESYKHNSANVTLIDESSYPSWHQYVRSPSSTTVLPKSIVTSGTQGSVNNPEGLLALGGGVTTFIRTQVAHPPTWPNGTTATASSTHSGNYSPMNAIDGNASTFWNDDTAGEYPDVLTITSPTTVKLPGLTILSNKDGVPMDFTVEVLSAKTNKYTVVDTVTNNLLLRYQINFTAPIEAIGVRITVTRDQVTTSGTFTRINEVYPGLVSAPPPPPAVIVDFGMVVTGVLSISFTGASNNTPGMRLAFSETMEYLADVSDFSRSYNVSLAQRNICLLC